MNHHARLESLKKTLIAATNLGDALDEFYQYGEQDSNFFQLGSPVHDSNLQALLNQTAQQTLNRSALMLSLVMVRIEDVGFVHGSFIYGEMMATFFYFDEEKTGLLTLGNQQTSQAFMTRFSPAS